jgi:hypothetical protein
MSHLEPRPTAIVSSQSAFPGRATWRTVVQNVISVVLTLGVVLPVVVAIAGEELADVLPSDWLLWAAGAAASVAAIAAALTRVMAPVRAVQHAEGSRARDGRRCARHHHGGCAEPDRSRCPPRD